MKKNLGSIDKVVRILIALAIVILAFTQVVTGSLAIVLLVLAALFVVTSVFSICPLYMLFGINTGKKTE